MHVSKVKYTDIAVRNLTCHTATGTHMPYRVTQCYPPPDGGDIPAFTPAEAGTQLSDPGGMQGWVDLNLVDQHYVSYTVNVVLVSAVGILLRKPGFFHDVAVWSVPAGNSF